MDSIRPTETIGNTDTQSVGSRASGAVGADLLAEVDAGRRRVENTLLDEIEVMVRFALGAGLDLPPEALATDRPQPPDAPPLAASAAGATLANLKRLSRYISDCTYGPRYDSRYWARLVVGLISGVILSQVVSAPWPAATARTPTVPPATRRPVSVGQFRRFPADLAHDILTHFIAVIGNALGLRKPR